MNEITAIVSTKRGSDGKEVRIEILNVPTEGLEWKAKRSEYRLRGSRHPLSKELHESIIGSTLDAVSVWGWGHMLQENQRLRKRIINTREWHESICDIARDVSIKHLMISSGGLAPDTDWEKTIDQDVMFRLHALSWANKKYIEELSEGIEAHAFGEILEFNEFDERVKLLLREDIYEFSPWHEMLRQEDFLANAFALTLALDNQ